MKKTDPNHYENLYQNSRFHIRFFELNGFFPLLISSLISRFEVFETLFMNISAVKNHNCSKMHQNYILFGAQPSSVYFNALFAFFISSKLKWWNEISKNWLFGKISVYIRNITCIFDSMRDSSRRQMFCNVHFWSVWDSSQKKFIELPETK